MLDFLRTIWEPVQEAFAKFREFAPNILAVLLIILLGFLLARIFRGLLRRFLKAVKFDAWSDRMGLTAVMRKADMWRRPSEAAASLVFWFLVLGTVMAGLSALHLQVFDNLVARFILYLPRAFSALFILVFGYIIAAFFGRAVLLAAVNSGYHYARLLAETVRLLLTVFVLAMALEQLQLAPGIVIAAFSIIFGGIILALAISFGVGGIDAARKMIERQEPGPGENKKDIEHI
ncbi:MAG: hypothetical protein PHX05_03745 [Acidobacteriota bacterium]|nr:hypothetical protein [Acidobacteriota bacterium]